MSQIEPNHAPQRTTPVSLSLGSLDRFAVPYVNPRLDQGVCSRGSSLWDCLPPIRCRRTSREDDEPLLRFRRARIVHDDRIHPHHCEPCHFRFLVHWTFSVTATFSLTGLSELAFQPEPQSNQAMDLTASWRTTLLYVTTSLSYAAERALARSSSSCSR
jgi:hypothetical protein